MVKNVNAIDTSRFFLKKTDYDAKINEIKGKVPTINGLATTDELNDFKKKIPSVSNLVKNQTDYDTKISEIKKNILQLLVI